MFLNIYFSNNQIVNNISVNLISRITGNSIMLQPKTQTQNTNKLSFSLALPSDINLAEYSLI